MFQKFFKEISGNLYELFTSKTRLALCIDLLSSVPKLELDYKFVRFFYNQILPQWLLVDKTYFDGFLTDVQRLGELIEAFYQLF